MITREAQPESRRRRVPRFFRHGEWELYRFGLLIGWHNLKAGSLRRLGFQKTMGKLLQPIISPSRFSEYDAVFRQLPLDGTVILDVGSPKIFDLWLATNHPVEIMATDIWSVPASEYANAWQQFTRKRAVPGRVRFITMDGTLSCFADGSFDCIFAVSVIEHIDGDGDRRFLDEAARLLAPGGRLIITVPFASRYQEQYRPAPMYRPNQTSQQVFFQRVYDGEAAELRLMGHDQLQVERVETLMLAAPAFEHFWGRLPTRLRGLLGFLNPVISGAAPRVMRAGFPGAQAQTLPDGIVEGDLLISYQRKN